MSRPTTRTFNVPTKLHPETADLVCEFAEVLAKKLRKAEVKRGWRLNWQETDTSELQEALIEHLIKGDPRDVAAFCAFLWWRGERTAARAVITL